MARVRRSRAGVTAALASSGYTRIAVSFSVLNIVLYSPMAVAQWAGWGGLSALGDDPDSVHEAVADGLDVAGINLAYGLVVIAATFAIRPHARSLPTRLTVLILTAIAASLLRIPALLALRSTPVDGAFVTAQSIIGPASVFVAVSAGLFTASLVARARDEERQRTAAVRQAARAINELQAEETRVRKAIADQLHGTLQFRLVSVTAGLDAIADRMGNGAMQTELRQWAETLEEIREEDVRSLSHTVFPSGADLGTTEAIQIMLNRLPASVATSVELGPRLQRFADEGGAPIPVPERLVAIYLVEEAVTNALKHGHARSVEVYAEVTPAADPEQWVLSVTVDDDGTGLASAAEPELHGLRRHADRLAYRGGTLEMTSAPIGGARLHFTLPFAQAEAATSVITPITISRPEL
ncbi:sensor histidine kinase [Gryllotalpicola reticulitermitis]|uniref:Sensor histidine kinase n=1 Tax=Gryllotalpicola reticulitermitis TaxID=1184153 RepID=A0ABV8Q9V8_9MICO